MNEDAALIAELSKSTDPVITGNGEPTVAEVATEQKPVQAETPKTEEAQKTVAELLGEPAEEIIEDLGNETVPLSAHLEMKRTVKELKKTVRELQQKATQGGVSDEEISEDLEAFAEEYPDVDPTFIQKLAKTLKKELKKESQVTQKPISEAERQNNIDNAFKVHFAKALDIAPEFKEVADAEVIKSLSLLPKNQNKTFVQIIEDTYGKFVVGKRTMDTTTPRGGHEPESVDMEKASTDEKYLDMVLASPKLKKEYNEKMQDLYQL